MEDVMTPLRLVLDPIACDGHGLCAELLPELIALDDWGYPVLVRSEVPPGLEGYARRAVATCPKLALRVESGSRAPRGPGGPPARVRRPAAPGVG
jgi:ferredoxin